MSGFAGQLPLPPSSLFFPTPSSRSCILPTFWAKRGSIQCWGRRSLSTRLNSLSGWPAGVMPNWFKWKKVIFSHAYELYPSFYFQVYTTKSLKPPVAPISHSLLFPCGHPDCGTDKQRAQALAGNCLCCSRVSVSIWHFLGEGLGVVHRLAGTRDHPQGVCLVTGTLF